MYAHVTNGTVDEVGQPPDLVFNGTRWWDLRELDPTVLAQVGWYLVTLTTQPANTAQNTSDASYTYSAGVVTQVWTVRPWTAAELAAQTAQTNYQAILTAITTQRANNTTFLGLTSPTNAQIIAQVQALTRQNNAMMRLWANDLTGTN